MNFIKKTIKIFNSEFFFSKPAEKKYLILDRSNSFIFNQYFTKNEVNILDTRYESINIYVLIKTFLKLRFTFNDYIVEYIRNSNCDFVISFIDNKIFYYKLKELFPKKKIIIIQNGMRTELFFEKLSKEKNLSVDYLLTFSDFYSTKYMNYINAKFISIGSFKNNIISQKNLKKERSISFISSGPSRAGKMKIFQNISLDIKEYFQAEKKLLPIISEYCKTEKYKLKILARSKSVKDFRFEKNFYSEIIDSQDFEFIDTFEKNRCYELSDISELSISIYSAFGLETLARGNRTIFFNVRDKATNFKSLNLFWSENKISKKGLFWSDEISNQEVERMLNYSLKCSNSEWQENIKKINPFIFTYDKDNEQFKNLLN